MTYNEIEKYVDDFGVIYNCDCVDFIQKMDTKSVDYSLTSPPYNRKRNDKYSFFNDIDDNWFQMNVCVIENLLRVTKNHVFYNIQSNYYNRSDVYKLIGNFHEKIVDIHIWEKTNPMPASGKNITNSLEFFIILGDSPLKSNTTYTKNIISTSVNSKMPKEHKAVMKLEVAEHFIGKFTKKDDVVFDCFFGLGTTGVACKKLNRKFIGIEKDANYFKMSIDRILKD